MSMFLKIVWFAAIGFVLSSAYFLGWISGVSSFIDTVNTEFWSKLPWEFQLFGTGAVIAMIFYVIYSFSGRD